MLVIRLIWNLHRFNLHLPCGMNTLFQTPVFENTTELISKYPKIGKKTELPDIRYKIVKDYLFTYRETEDHIEILTIWDSRQDPDKFDRIIKNTSS